VDVSHYNVTNLVCNRPGALELHPGLKVGSVLSISFDMGKIMIPLCQLYSNAYSGAWEILGTVANGSTLVLRGSDWNETLQEVCVKFNLKQAIDLRTNCQIDVLICTPTILSRIDPLRYPKIRTVATAGEPLPQQ
jgi:hypothetical protein